MYKDSSKIARFIYTTYKIEVKRNTEFDKGSKFTKFNFVGHQVSIFIEPRLEVHSYLLATVYLICKNHKQCIVMNSLPYGMTLRLT